MVWLQWCPLVRIFISWPGELTGGRAGSCWRIRVGACHAIAGTCTLMENFMWTSLKCFPWMILSKNLSSVTMYIHTHIWFRYNHGYTVWSFSINGTLLCNDHHTQQEAEPSQLSCPECSLLPASDLYLLFPRGCCYSYFYRHLSSSMYSLGRLLFIFLFSEHYVCVIHSCFMQNTEVFGSFSLLYCIPFVCMCLRISCCSSTLVLLTGIWIVSSLGLLWKVVLGTFVHKPLGAHCAPMVGAYQGWDYWGIGTMYAQI